MHELAIAESVVSTVMERTGGRVSVVRLKVGRLSGVGIDMLATGVDVRVTRDPTRGGVSATLNEIAKDSGVGVELVENDLPVPPEVLAAMRQHPRGAGARRIGTCVADHPQMVVARTGLGGTCVVDLPIGEQLPRIC